MEVVLNVPKIRKEAWERRRGGGGGWNFLK